MLFSGKENVFMCLVAFQKIFQKIFSDAWLCSWKYHRKHILYLLLTFSRLPNEYIISFIPQNTKKKKKTQKKKIIKSGHFARSRLVRRRDRDRHGQCFARSVDRDRSFARSARCRWCRRTISASSALDDLYSLFFLSPSLSFSRSLSLSLSPLFSKAENYLKWKWKRKWFSVVLALIFGQLEMLFSLTEFEVTTKHPIFRKIISRISLKSIQTQPKVLLF